MLQRAGHSDDDDDEEERALKQLEELLLEAEEEGEEDDEDEAEEEEEEKHKEELDEQQEAKKNLTSSAPVLRSSLSEDATPVKRTPITRTVSNHAINRFAGPGPRTPESESKSPQNIRLSTNAFQASPSAKLVDLVKPNLLAATVGASTVSSIF